MERMQLIFLVVLFCGFALNSNAQSETTKQEGQNFWPIPVICDDVNDVLEGPFYFHMVKHWNPETGQLEWYKFSFKSDEIKSRNTGEVFSVNYCIRAKFGPYEETFHFNARGDQGSHYIGSLTFVPGVGITSINMRCL